MHTVQVPSCYICETPGCDAPTATHFCAAHRVQCVSCDEERDASMMLGDECLICRQQACQEWVEDDAAECWCGQHECVQS